MASQSGCSTSSSHGMDLGDAVALGEALDPLPATLLLFCRRDGRHVIR